MLELAIMIEGQNGLNWERWQRMAHAVEDWGFVGDHYTHAAPPGEGAHIVKHLLHTAEPLTFNGRYFRLNEESLLPRPQRRIPILIGGNGEQKTLPLVARYADEWNATFQTPENFARLNTRLDELLAATDGEPRLVKRSLMTGCVFGKNEFALKEKITARNRTYEQLRERGVVVGSASQIVEQLGQLANAGVQRVMLRWLDLDDRDGLEAFARDVLWQIKAN